MTRKLALGLIFAALLSSVAYAGERGNYTIRDKDYRVEGYVRNGKIYDRDYRIQGYVTGDKIRDKDYRVKGYVDRDNRGRGGSDKRR